MAIAYHTHTFEIPTATNAETQAGVITDKVVIPSGLAAALASYVTSTALTTTLADYALSASLGTAAAEDVGYFATAAQGALADSAIQPAAIGVSVQAYSAYLSTIAGLAKTDGNFIVGNGTDWTAESGATARTSLGVAIGSDVQAYSANLDEYAAVNPTVAGLALLDDVDAAAQRTTLGLGTMATQAASAVAITGGSVAGITDLAVADGGTGASDAATARTNLGLVIGTNVQAYDADLAAIAGLTTAADKVPYFTGAGTAALADFSAFGRTLVDDANAAAGRTTLGAMGTGFEGATGTIPDARLPTRLMAYAYPSSVVTDWDNATENGVYYANGAANTPGGLAEVIVRVAAASTNYVEQMAYGNAYSGGTDARMFRRVRVVGTWQAWDPIHSTEGELDARYAQLAAANTFTKAQTVTPVALTDGATVALDLSLSNDYTLTLGGNRTLGNPTNRTVGQWFSITITQDGGGGRTLAYDTHYKFPGGPSAAPVLTTTANAYDTLTFRVKSATEVQLVGIAKAFG